MHGRETNAVERKKQTTKKKDRQQIKCGLLNVVYGIGEWIKKQYLTEKLKPRSGTKCRITQPSTETIRMYKLQGLSKRFEP